MIGSYISNGWTPFTSQWWGDLFQFPYDLCREIKAFYQRGMYGYADCDLWSLGNYLAEWIPSALTDLEVQGGKVVDFQDLDFEKMRRGFRTIIEEDEVMISGRVFEEYLAEMQELADRSEDDLIYFVKNIRKLWW